MGLLQGFNAFKHLQKCLGGDYVSVSNYYFFSFTYTETLIKILRSLKIPAQNTDKKQYE